MFKKKTVNLDTARNIEANTINQSENPQWFSERQLRLTTSKFAVILKKIGIPNEKFLDNIFQPKDLSHVAAKKKAERKRV